MLNHNNIITDEPNVVITVHLYITDLFAEMCEYIDNVKRVFKNVVVFFSINNESRFDNEILKKYSEAIIIKVENRGVDIFPFIETIKYIRQHEIPCDFILKMHTKLNSPPCFGSNWRHSLLKPITKMSNLIILKHYFKSVKNIGYVSAQRCVLPKNHDKFYPGTIKGIHEIISLFPHLEKNWTDFNAGNMFWINNAVLDKYLTHDLINFINSKFCHGKPPCDLGNNTPIIEYICERIFTGIFCYNSINIFVTDYETSNAGLDIDKSYYYQPEIFSFHTPKILATFTGHV